MLQDNRHLTALFTPVKGIIALLHIKSIVEAAFTRPVLAAGLRGAQRPHTPPPPTHPQGGPGFPSTVCKLQLLSPRYLASTSSEVTFSAYLPDHMTRKRVNTTGQTVPVPERERASERGREKARERERQRERRDAPHPRQEVRRPPSR